MEQHPNGDVSFYASMRKSFIFCVLFIMTPMLAFLFFVMFILRTADISFFFVAIGMCALIFGITYLGIRKTKMPPMMTVHQDSLEFYTKYGSSFTSLEGIIGFTITKGILNAQMLVFITHDFKKKRTRCSLRFLDPEEKSAFLGVLQSKGLTFFPDISRIKK